MQEDHQPLNESSGESTTKPNTITPSIEGFFRVPAIWVGESPDPETVRILNLEVHHAVVLETELDCGITVRVQRDGTFLFDFSSWELAPQVEIPGYRLPGPGVPHKLPVETADALQTAETYAVIRAKVMNVQQACLATSEQLLKCRFAQMGFPVDAQISLKGQTFEDAVSYRENESEIHFLARNTANNRYTVSPNRLLPRRLLEQEVVNHSLMSLDRILLENDVHLIHMIDSLYGAARSFSGRRSGEATVVAWAVCEQLLSSAWNSLLSDNKDEGRMPGKRRKKLGGLDYTASVKIEILEMNDRVDNVLYDRLEVARKARNDWAHKMREPESWEVYETIWAAQDLLLKIMGVRIQLSLTGPGPGVPEWYILPGGRITKRGQH